MASKTVGARGVNEVAEKMGVNKSYVTNATRNALRKLRWPNRLRSLTRFLDEYYQESTRSD